MREQTEIEHELKRLQDRSLALQSKFVDERKGNNETGVLRNINGQLRSVMADIKTLQWVLGQIEWES